jgi:hypothetical protein
MELFFPRLMLKVLSSPALGRRVPGQPVQCVSFPRSGHHLLMDILSLYYGRNGFRYCEFYTHCRRSPCANPAVNFQKNHDLALDLKVPRNTRCLVQVRRPIESIVSWFVWQCGQYPETEDSRASWEAFAREKARFWKRFAAKWTGEDPDPGKLVVRYDKLVQKPLETTAEVVRFLSPGRPPQLNLLKQIVAVQRVRRGLPIERFKYYDAGFFGEIEKDTAG